LRDGDPIGAERIGAYLARQRQLRGISVEDLAAQMRIPLRSLQRLEAGAFDHDPDGFARGFVRTVAMALGLPPDETIARMLPEADDGEGGPGAGALVWIARGVVGAALFGADEARATLTLVNSKGTEHTVTRRYEVVGRGGRGFHLIRRDRFVRMVPPAIALADFG
jgi:transcriptional regulator with XRE-family HTH domain